jgi:cysteine desulfurase
VNYASNERIYLDNAATTCMRPEVRDAMDRALRAGPYNPSSLHAEGRAARALIDEARERVASLLGASRKEILFTSGGTEADNLAILGVARALRATTGRRHVVSSVIEHHAVLHAVDALREYGFEVTLLGVNERGIVEPAAFGRALRDDTLLASIMYANNEIGTIQPIAELAGSARARGVVFHTDAVQAPSWLPVNATALGVDLLSLSAHKFGGPKGIGALYVRRGLPIAPILHGGGQEFGHRSGTENVAGIVGLSQALELAEQERATVGPCVAALRDRLEHGLQASLGGVRVNGAGAPRLPNISNLSFAGITSDALLMRLDLGGLAVSAGSACTSGVLEPSHVLAALGVEAEWQTGALRFSLGPTTTKGEIERVLALVSNVVEELRVKSPA